MTFFGRLLGKRRTKKEDDALLVQDLIQKLVILRFQYDKATEALHQCAGSPADRNYLNLQDERSRIGREIRLIQAALRDMPLEQPTNAPFGCQPRVHHMACII